MTGLLLVQNLIPITESEVWNTLHLEQTLSSGDLVRLPRTVASQSWWGC